MSESVALACENQLRKIKSQLLQIGPVASAKKSLPNRLQKLPSPLRKIALFCLKAWNFLYKDQYAYNEQILAILEEMQTAQKLLLSQANQSPVTAASPSSQRLSDFYLQLERRFRGSYGAVKSRLEVYLEYLPAEPGLRALDMGIGRGEWMDLLKSRGFVTYGVDINPEFVQKALGRGHRVLLEDVLVFLRGTESESFDVVSAFHLIEHLPIPDLLELFAETYRVLKPGGVFIIETPNPENILVSTQTFYLDPTHLHPIPRALAEFIFEYSGFGEITALPLHPNENRLISNSSIVAERINRHFYGPQDLGLVGKKGPRA